MRWEISYDKCGVGLRDQGCGCQVSNPEEADIQDVHRVGLRDKLALSVTLQRQGSSEETLSFATKANFSHWSVVASSEEQGMYL